MRFIGGNNDLEGLVEMCFFGVWGTICSDGWDITDADVVCRQLGYDYEGTLDYCFSMASANLVSD